MNDAERKAIMLALQAMTANISQMVLGSPLNEEGAMRLLASVSLSVFLTRKEEEARKEGRSVDLQSKDVRAAAARQLMGFFQETVRLFVEGDETIQSTIIDDGKVGEHVEKLNREADAAMRKIGPYGTRL